MNSFELQIQRATAALRNLFIADALAMPVHWYYNIRDIEKAFPGGVKQLEAAPQFHPSSIMSLHSTTSGGRRYGGSAKPQAEIVGDVILKGRRQYWGQANVHYHQGMKAGENTLNAQCMRVLMRTLAAQSDHYDPRSFLADYIQFMTAEPPLHNDTYAESYHRGFFANLQQGLPCEKCAALTHDTPSIGGLVSIAALVLAQRLREVPLQRVLSDARVHLALTHPDAGLARICDAYVQLIDSLLFNEDTGAIAGIIAETAKRSVGLDLPALIGKNRDDREVIGQLFSSACYIDGAWPGILYLLYKYQNQPEAALLANTNLGGDNVHRGAVLGVLLGLIHAHTIEHWYKALVEHDQIEREINQLLG
ncbi:MAG: ADP-ribosylglycohydrolase family protein [Pseudohongiella sp.]|nr:ADP-ribosylglycohydrolase family protein [Pseudohongiella sp.]